MMPAAFLDSAFLELDSSHQPDDGASVFTVEVPISFLTPSSVLRHLICAICQPGSTIRQTLNVPSLSARLRSCVDQPAKLQSSQQKLLGRLSAASDRVWPLWKPRKASCGQQRQLSLDVKLRSGTTLHLDFAGEATLEEVQEAVQSRVHVPHQRQLLVVCEERARFASFPQLLQRMSKRWQARPALRQVALSWANFALLPELFNRELYGRGLINWAKTTAWWQALSSAQQAAAATRASASNQVAGAASSPVQYLRVELLSGAMEHVEVDARQTLAELQTLVEQRTGVTRQQQRLLITEQPGPGVVSLVTSTLALHGIAGIKGAAAWGSWACMAVARRMRESFAYPLTIHTATGACFTIPVTGDMTLDEIRMRLAELELQEAIETPVAPTQPYGSLPALPNISSPAKQASNKPPQIARIDFPGSLDCALEGGLRGNDKPKVRSMPWLLSWSRAWL